MAVCSFPWVQAHLNKPIFLAKETKQRVHKTKRGALNGRIAYKFPTPSSGSAAGWLGRPAVLAQRLPVPRSVGFYGLCPVLICFYGGMFLFLVSGAFKQNHFFGKKKQNSEYTRQKEVHSTGWWCIFTYKLDLLCIGVAVVLAAE
jgi:hypothetical protein